MRHHDTPQPIVGISVIEHAPLALFHPEFLKVSATASVSMQARHRCRQFSIFGYVEADQGAREVMDRHGLLPAVAVCASAKTIAAAAIPCMSR
jgi:hypothetical protein